MTIIVVVLKNRNGNDRRDVEMAQNQVFHSVDAIRDEFPNATLGSGDLGLYNLDEFMDACNDSDDDCPEDLAITLEGSWIGYVQLKNNKS